jgi:hypothetical protein
MRNGTRVRLYNLLDGHVVAEDAGLLQDAGAATFTRKVALPLRFQEPRVAFASDRLSSGLGRRSIFRSG